MHCLLEPDVPLGGVLEGSPRSSSIQGTIEERDGAA
jgi:hypothetical protein